MNDARRSSATDLEEQPLARSLLCRRCGYDLRGLRLGGQCPECGEDVWLTVLEVVDPTARKLPVLRSPRRVGNGLLLLMIFTLSATLLIAARAVALQIDQFTSPNAIKLSQWTPVWLSMLSAVLLFAAIWPVMMIAPPRGKEPEGVVWSSIRHLIIGLALIGTAVGAGVVQEMLRANANYRGPDPYLMQRAINCVMILGGLIAMPAVRRVLKVIGERSREYRNAVGSRQRIRDMIVGLYVVLIGEGFRIVGAALDQTLVRKLGVAIEWVAMFMLLIGLAYLLVNAAWIRKSLRRPPPTLRELLRPPPEELSAVDEIDPPIDESSGPESARS